MRTLVVRSAVVMVLLAGALAAFAAPARADSGSPFNPGDGRVNPMTGDRLAVYCNNSNVDVWGIDGNEEGFHLTTFSLPELLGSKTVTHLTTDGTVSLKMDAAAQSHWGFADSSATTESLITDVGTQYHIAWNGGTMGANGSGGFYKVFSCTYEP